MIVVIVVRKGRKRKQRPRHECGKLVQDKIDVKAVAIAMPDRQHVPELLRHDHRASTPLGGLCLLGVISEAQHQAGVNYARAVNRYRAVIIEDCPDPFPPSIAGYNQPQGPSRIPDENVVAAIRDEYNGPVEALWRDAGQRACRAVARVAVYNEVCSSENVKHLKRGLEVLAAYYGLTGRRKYAFRNTG